MVRQRNRYILCEAVFPDRQYENIPLTNHAAYDAIRKVLHQMHGDYGLAALIASLNVKYVNPDTRIVIIRAARSHYKLVTSSLPFVRQIGSEKGFFKTLHIGGTIRTCQKFVVKHHRQQLTQLLRVTTDPGENNLVKIVPIAGAAVVVAYLVYRKMAGGSCCGGGDSGLVNRKVKKDQEKVADVVNVNELSDKTAFCRCWRSNKFPYCDGSHNKHNKETGDNVGPLVVNKKAD